MRGERPLLGLGSLIWGLGGVQMVASLWQSGLWDMSCSLQNKIPTMSAAPGGSRRLPRGGEEALVWPSLVIRPFNCNYFCN